MRKIFLLILFINTLIIKAQDEADTLSMDLCMVRISSDCLGQTYDQVYVDGVFIDAAPCITEVPAGRHTISVMRDGETVRQRVRLEASEKKDTTWIELNFGLKAQWRENVPPRVRNVVATIVENLVFVEGGIFVMGTNNIDADRDERPAHRVKLSPYFIGKYEVTNRQWFAVMANDSVAMLYDNDNTPKANITSLECVAFVDSLRAFTNLNFSIPTEAQWELAAKGGVRGNKTEFSGGKKLNDVAWYFGNSGDKPQHDEDWRPVLLTTNKNAAHTVGQKEPNELGIYDMTGNVYEFCTDFFDNYKVERGTVKTNPTGPSRGQYVVVRGGSWLSTTFQSRVTYRTSCDFRQKSPAVGLRIVVN